MLRLLDSILGAVAIEILCLSKNPLQDKSTQNNSSANQETTLLNY